MTEHQNPADHPHSDPGDGRSECGRCGKFVWLVTHSCKGIPVTAAARARHAGRCVHCGTLPGEHHDLARHATAGTLDTRSRWPA